MVAFKDWILLQPYPPFDAAPDEDVLFEEPRELRLTGPYNIKQVCTDTAKSHFEIYCEDFTIILLTAPQNASVTFLRGENTYRKTFTNWDNVTIQKFLFAVLCKDEYPKAVAKWFEEPKPTKQKPRGLFGGFKELFGL